MKTNIKFLIASLLIITLYSCKNDNNEFAGKGYSINGKIIGLDSGVININQEECTVENGRFSLMGKLEAPTMFQVRIKEVYTTYFVENSKIEVTINLNDIDETTRQPKTIVKGSETHDEYVEVTQIIRNTPESKKLQELFNLGQTLEKGSEAYKKNYEAISNAREANRKVQSAFVTNYALKNPESVVAALWMQYQKNEVDQTFEEYEQIVNGFENTIVAKTKYFKSLKDELEALKRVAVGNKAPDFTLKTSEDEDFTLSSLRGDKIVLVDFWASWCLPCRKSYPHLKEVYKKYKNKGFEIVAVTNDSNHDAWKKAILEDETKWIQVADIFPPRGSEVMTAKVITAYAAPFLPSTYLLDKNGVILAKNLHADELDLKLEEIFGF